MDGVEGALLRMADVAGDVWSARSRDEIRVAADRVTARGYAEAITTPTLVFGAGRDRIVDTEATRAFAARLPNGRYEEIAEAEHEILMENDAIRARFWDAFDTFVADYA